MNPQPPPAYRPPQPAPPRSNKTTYIVAASVVAVALVLLAAVLITRATEPGYAPGPLSNSTACGVFTADQAAGDNQDINTFMLSENPFMAGDDLVTQFQGEANVLPGLLDECASNPSEVLSAAYNKALAASPAIAGTAGP